MESTLAGACESRDNARLEKSLLEKNFNELGEQAYALLGVCELLDSQLKSLQEEFGKESEKMAQYDSWMQEVGRDIQDVFSSFRWKIGDRLASVAEIMLFRFNKKTARDHINQILGEYDSFIISGGHPLQISNGGGKAKDDAGKWGTFCRLALAALKNPAQTASLLDADRLKNLYVTLFKQSPHVRKNIFDYYLQLYGENSTASIQALMEKTKNSLSNLDGPSLLQVENPLVSIVIPVYNQWEYTEKCIRSILHGAPGMSYEIILADDHSTDETINALKHFPELKIVKTPENAGFLKNCNNAALQARGDYLVFLNNDTLVHEKWLQGLLDVFDHDSMVGMAGSKLVYPDGKLQEAGGIIWKDASGWNFGRLDNPDKPEYNYDREVDYVSGASIMIRASLWREIGGFDERYVPAYYEDTDLAFAVRASGYKVVYTPFSVVTHFEGQSHGTDETTGIKQYQGVNNRKFAEKWSDVLARDHFENGENVFLARERAGNKKIMLVVDHYVPHYDKDAGSRSTFQYLQWFVEKGLNVKFIGDNFFQHEPYTSDLQRLGIEVLYGPWYAENWQKWLKENGRFIDYAYLHRPHIAPKYIDAVRKFTRAKIIYFGHDLHFMRTERQYAVEKRDELKKLASEWRSKEFDIFNKVDVIYYPSLIEEAEVKKFFPDKCVRAIPLNVYDQVVVDESHLPERKDLMFVGGFGHEPNRDGVLWFVQEVFPLVLEKNKAIRFVIAGSKMPESILGLQAGNVIIAGEVTDEALANIYQESRISIVPLRYGAGIKGKVLEALRMQIPVVTTGIGAEGLPEPESYLQIADNPKDFAEKILQLYADEKLWHTQVASGVDCLNRYFSKQRVEEIWGQDVDLPG